MNIGVDVDGVLADFVSGFTALSPNPRHRRSAGGQADWNLRQVLSQDEQDAMWETVRGSTNFWYGLNTLLTEHEIEEFRDLTRKHKVFYITNRFGENALEQTRNWLADFDFKGDVIVSKDKVADCQRLAVDLMIEDGPVNLQELWATDIATVRRDWPYNRWLEDRGPWVGSMGEFIWRFVNG